MSEAEPQRGDLNAGQLARFVRRLEAYPRMRIPLEEIWRLFADAFPYRPQGREERVWLLRALSCAVEDGAVKWPAETGKRWDRSMDPALPRAVDRVSRPARGEPPPWRKEAWHPRLLWILDLPRLSDEQYAFLRRVHQGLVEGWFQHPAPLRHRSLQLTPSEKGLARFMRTRLFGEDRLSLDLLGCLREATPLAWERVGPGRRMIVFENAGPFHVGREVLRTAVAAPFGMIGYGGGDGFQHAIRWLDTLDERPERIVYVGDLDRSGLRIAVTAARVAREVGLPPLEPATALHARMIERAAGFGRAAGWPHERRLPFKPEWIDWLGSEVRTPVAEMLQARHRIPEEVLGPEDLREFWG